MAHAFIADSIVKQHRHESSPVFFGRPRAALVEVQFFAPRGERSAGRRGGLRDLLSGWRSRPRRLRGVSFLLAIGGRRLPALHLRRFLSPWGRASGRRQATTALIRSGGHRSFIVHTCSPARGQPVVMPADGWLGPPGSAVTSPARGRRISLTGFPTRPGETTRPHLRPRPSPLLRPRHVSGDAPRRAGRTYNRYSTP